MMLTIDDAVKVAKRLIQDWGEVEVDECDEDYIRQEMEQKCWLVEFDETPLKDLVNLIMEINPEVIATRIANDNLRTWCESIQIDMQLCLIKIKGID